MTGQPAIAAEQFARISAEHERCFWLDGGGGLDWSGRRSLLGWLDPEDVSLSLRDGLVRRHEAGTTAVVGDDVFAVLADEVAADVDQDVHWVGYLGYAARADLPALRGGPAPDAVWMRARHVTHFAHEPFTPRPGVPVAGGGDPPSSYVAAFEAVQEALHAGHSYEVNLTHRLVRERDLDPAAAYLRLREVNPAPYAGYLQHGVGSERMRLLSSSPERYAVVDRHRLLETKPIKGTTPRGATPAEDDRLREQLVTDPKTRAENLMIVDLLRNDLAMVCEPGSVRVPSLMEAETYASVHQLVSTVRGHLREGISTVDALRALFPAGSMTGAPKRRTMEVIAAVESTPRGAYSGAFGWVHPDGRADLGVVIRSLVATPAASGWRYELGTGGGITVRSDVTAEWHETGWKAARLLAALD